jgi:signal transduction histidine kinase
MKIKVRLQFSNPLRWFAAPLPMTLRLPLTYAAIALLVTLSIGVVLLTTLQRYYTAREVEYLQTNAINISNVLALLMESDIPPEEIQAQVEFFSFLARTRIEILSETGELVAGANVTELMAQPFAENPEARGLFVSSSPAQGDVLNYFFTSSEDAAFPAMPLFNTSTEGEQAVFTVERIEDERIRMEGFPPLQASVSAPVDVRAGVHIENPDMPVPPDEIRIQIVPSLYGFGIRDRIVEMRRDARSEQEVMRLIQTPDGRTIGTLRISNGPAYGTEIVESVARGWLLASAFSITLAIFVGWMMSKSVVRPLVALTQATNQMEQGDLSARADVLGQDEFGQMAQSFNRMAQRIEETISTLQRFVSDAAHELNTPITALRTNLELIALDTSEPEVMQRALSQIKRLEDLTQNLLRLSQLESQAENSEIVPVDVVAITREVVQFHASQAEQAGVTLETAIPQAPILVDAHDNQLHHALSNLVHNAIKFTPASGQVAVTVACDTSHVTIVITDTGIGIPEADIPFVFNRFHRGRNVSRYAGSGLGLAIVKAIITRFNGVVSAQSTDRGSLFTVQLPLRTGATNDGKHH